MATSDIKKGPLYVDSTNNRVGIGLTDPEQLLHLKNASGNCVAVLGQYGTGTKATITAASNQVELKADSGTNDIMTFKTGSSERLRIDSSGNVGIGTNSPTATFRTSIKGDYSSIIGGIEFDSGGGDKFTIGHATATSPSGTINVVGAGNLIMKTNNAERMRLTSAGDFQVSQNGIVSTGGTVSGVNISAQYGTFQANFHGNDYPILNIHSSGANNRFFNFRFGNSSVGNVTTNGSTTSYSTSSDYRLKENVTYDWNATSRLKQLKPARFNFIADPDTTVDGFIAHECGAVPESITGEKDAVDDDGKIIPQGIDQSKIVPLLTKALIEAVEKIEALEARITALAEQDT